MAKGIRTTKRTTRQVAKQSTTRQSPRNDNAEGEAAVLAAIAAMPEPNRTMSKRLHAIIKASAPVLSSKLWYGMPAYAKEGKVICFFQSAHKVVGYLQSTQKRNQNQNLRPATGRAPWMTLGARYTTLGFSDAAKLDEGALWPIGFAVKELTPASEATIAALVKKAAS